MSAAPAGERRQSTSFPRRSDVLWLIVASGWAAVTVLLVGADAAPAVRAPAAIAFVLLCPGLPVIRLLQLGNRPLEWTLVIALSLSLDVLVASALLYAGAWSPFAAACLLAAITIAASLAAAGIRATSPTG